MSLRLTKCRLLPCAWMMWAAAIEFGALCLTKNHLIQFQIYCNDAARMNRAQKRAHHEPQRMQFQYGGVTLYVLQAYGTPPHAAGGENSIHMIFPLMAPTASPGRRGRPKGNKST